MEEYQLSIDIRNYDTETKHLLKVRGYNDRYQLTVSEYIEFALENTNDLGFCFLNRYLIWRNVDLPYFRVIPFM